MSRILLMLMFILWMMWRPESAPSTTHLELKIGLFFGFYALLILTLGLWSRFLARRVVHNNLHKSVGRFNRMVGFARWVIPAWFAIGIWVLGWGDCMQMIFPPIKPGDQTSFMGMHSPAVFLGIMPGLLTWMGLWWAQFPADRALREMNLLNQLEANLPLVAPPRFWDYFSSNFRMQVLFIALPLMLIVMMEDVLTKCWLWAGQTQTDLTEVVCAVASLVIVFLFSPLVLTRALSTEPLPDSPLRRRLVAMCRRTGVKYREILLWRTNGNICNAAVMGLASPVRYVMLSDVLLETMSDEQIEAVFAHEMGHVVHRHMVWYAIFFILCMAGIGALGNAVESSFAFAGGVQVFTLGSMALLFWAFGFVSRQCERQADVYAARLMELEHRTSAGSMDELVWNPGDLTAPLTPAIAGAQFEMAMPVARHEFPNPSVGRHGAAIFSSALHRVAVVNNIPLARFEWLHGSIKARMDSSAISRSIRNAATPSIGRCNACTGCCCLGCS